MPDKLQDTHPSQDISKPSIMEPSSITPLERLHQLKIPTDRAPESQEEANSIYARFMGDLYLQKEFESRQADLAFQAMIDLDEPTDNWHRDAWIRYCTHSRDLPWFAYMVTSYNSLQQIIITDDNLVDLVCSAWTICEYPESNLDGGIAAWELVFGTVGYVSDPTGLERPESPLRLYRGATEEKKRGMAWTSDRAIADLFARRSTYGDLVGKVWEAEIQPDEVWARFDARQEHEYVVDTTELEIEEVNGDLRT